MSHFKLFIELTRFQKPIGYMLLLWPCAWGLTISFDFSNKTSLNKSLKKLSRALKKIGIEPFISNCNQNQNQNLIVKQNTNNK